MIQRLLPFFTLIALFVILSIASPNFLTATNLSSVVRQTAVINIMALGMTVIIIAGGIDLSVGSILALAGLLGTMTMEKEGIAMGMIVGILTGMACGFCQRSDDHIAAHHPFYRDARHHGDFPRAGVDHLQRSADS